MSNINHKSKQMKPTQGAAASPKMPKLLMQTFSQTFYLLPSNQVQVIVKDEPPQFISYAHFQHIAKSFIGGIHAAVTNAQTA